MTHDRTRHVPIRCATVIAAPAERIADALADSTVWIRAARAFGGSLQIAGETSTLQSAGMVRYRSHRGRTTLFRVTESGGLPVLESVFPLAGTTIRIRCVLAPTAAGVLTTIEFSAGPGRSSLRSLALAATVRGSLVRFGETLLGIVALTAREPVRVVAAALIADGQILVAKRKPGVSRAGHWEFPGGKVEPGETDREALRRELWEELGLHTKVSQRIGPMIEVDPLLEMYCYRAEMTPGGEIRLADHDEYRWVGPDELDSVDLPDSDRLLVDSLRIALRIGP